MNYLISSYGYISLILVFLINILILFTINKFFLLKNFCLDKVDSSPHKNYVKSGSVPISGGIVIMSSLIIFNYFDKISNLLFALSIFVIGIMSDLDKLKSTNIRFLFQIFVLILFLLNNNYLLVNEIKISSIDLILGKYEIISLIFTCFCILILINGSNFIDGTNIQCSGYFFSILMILIILNFEKSISVDLSNILIIFSVLISFIIFNLFNKSFLGDGGTYLLSFLIGIILIKFYLTNNVSPYFIVTLLWYPAFENFFSIVRRLFLMKRNIDKPDNLHLHHMIYSKLNKKFKNKFIIKNGVGLLLSTYNFLIFFIAKNFIFQSLIQVYLILFSIILYISVYSIFVNKKL